MTLTADTGCSKFCITGGDSKHELCLILKLTVCGRKEFICNSAVLKNTIMRILIVTTGHRTACFFPSEH